MGFIETRNRPIPSDANGDDQLGQERKLVAQAVYQIVRPFVVAGITYREQEDLLPRITRKELARATGLNIEQLLEATDNYIFSDPDGQNWKLSRFSVGRGNLRPKKAKRIAGAKLSERKAARSGGSESRTFAAMTGVFRRDAWILDLKMIDRQPTSGFSTNGLTTTEIRNNYLDAAREKRLEEERYMRERQFI